MTRPRTVTIMILIGFVLAGAWAARGNLLPAVGRWLDSGDSPQKANLIMVLNGDEDSRPFAAATLYQLGWAPSVALARTAPSFNARDDLIPPEHAINEAVLRACGVPAESIVVLDADAASTFDEAQALARHLKRVAADRVLIVTSGPHVRRAGWIFRRELGSDVEVGVVAAPTEAFDADTWWQTERGFVMVAEEYLKLAFYFCQYTHLLPILGVWAIVIVTAVAWRNRRRRTTH